MEGSASLHCTYIIKYIQKINLIFLCFFLKVKREVLQFNINSFIEFLNLKNIILTHIL